MRSASLSRSSMLAATAAAIALRPRPVRSQSLEKLRMSAVPTDDMTPIYWAAKTGMYRKVGLDLEIIPVSSGSASTAAVIGGAYELGKASPAASLLAHLRGLPVTIIANGSVSLPRSQWSGMLVAADSTIKTGADLNGKTGAAAGLNDINQLAMMNWVDKTGGDSKSMKWVEIPGSAEAAALADHRVDVIVLNEPNLTAALEGGKVRLLTNAFNSVADRWLTSAYLAQPDFANKHAELMRRFQQVTYESATYTNAHENETIAMMSEASKIQPSVFSKMHRIDGATSGDPGLLSPVIEMTYRYKVLPKMFPASEMYWNA